MPVHRQLAFPLTLARSSFTSHLENRLSPNHVSYSQNRTTETSKSDRLLMQNHLIPRHTLTVRVGCAFSYEAAMPVAMVLTLKPRRDPWQALQEEKLVLGSNLPAEEFEDEHGNIVYRLLLQPGLNEFRHDAILAVSPFADNHEFGPG